MRNFTFKYYFLVGAIMIFSFRAPCQSKKPIDSNIYAIIPFHKQSFMPFDSSYRSTSLIKSEIELMETLLKKCIAEYNSIELKENLSQNIIDITKTVYKKQLVAVLNRKGEKEVWMNCFCDNIGPKWKKYILMVDDGGNCYFNLKVNLTTKTYSNLRVNGNGYRYRSQLHYPYVYNTNISIIFLFTPFMT